MKRWKKLTNDELRGAHYGLRVLRTSPRIVGQVLALPDELLIEMADESRRRAKDSKPRKKGAK